MDEQGIEMPDGMEPGRNQPEGTPSADQMPAPQSTPAADVSSHGANPQSGQRARWAAWGKNENMRVASQNLIDALIALLESKAPDLGMRLKKVLLATAAPYFFYERTVISIAVV
jgi:hypothetical protein